MIDDDLVRAHRNNIQRYHLLLQTTLTEFERQYVERRLSEEQSKLDKLTTRAQTANRLQTTQARTPDEAHGFAVNAAAEKFVRAAAQLRIPGRDN
ncbi:hypothetical protein IVB57_29005 [Bradyrhizobium sp. CW9]|uniref:hypothetical protein n=1 Tax=Bradyrhizobium sp. CW9 TaxID=2782689 RepID=UPI001FFB9CFC|nr:hypothetical protein [Bradyrhizobium sp. CW9]MCK1332314.1 hypothetical protein [Bradyrhizobium sp. CW9]